MRRTVLIVIVILVVFAGLLLVMRHRAPKPPPPTTAQVWSSSGVPVETSSIARGDMEQTVEVTGDIYALNTATLSSKIAGRIAVVYVREGDRVSPGQTIAMLDQDDPRSNLQNAQAGMASAMARLSQARTNAKVTRIETDSTIEQAQATLNSALSKLEIAKTPTRSQDRMVAENKVASAKASLDNAKANYRRDHLLLKEGAISPSAFDVINTQFLVAQADYKSAQDELSMIVEGGRLEDIAAAQSQVDVAREQLRAARANASQNLLREEDIKSAEADVQQAQAAVALAKQQLENTYIKSPIAGEISARMVDPGQVVSPGQSMAAVVKLDSVYFKGDVSETGLADVSPGQPVRVHVDALPGMEFQGTVTEIYPAGSTTSRNFSVRITIQESDHQIKPGMFARGEIVTGLSKNVMLIPKDAVDTREGTQSVFTLNPDKTVKRHIVEEVRENLDYVQIQTPSDLSVGDTVVTTGRQNLQEGTKVHVAN